ncbi:hypothetical protein [Alicyclobacillus tolerans]|uniref:Uncharacterized protein n=1 Tax=Alicyclobacillus tolerans TaxID=90970 RepID=A0A1M6YD22_9BACL|nr:hypothetical protein [Alicyclobacillus montanus]SHL16204.1 hypothetical protein SAMN05443507_1494 [Alicyclobacillus montanus]
MRGTFKSATSGFPLKVISTSYHISGCLESFDNRDSLKVGQIGQAVFACSQIAHRECVSIQYSNNVTNGLTLMAVFQDARLMMNIQIEQECIIFDLWSNEPSFPTRFLNALVLVLKPSQVHIDDRGIGECDEK